MRKSHGKGGAGKACKVNLVRTCQSQGSCAKNETLPVGATATVTRVPDSDRALLRYLGELGLLPGVTVRVRRKEPFGGPLYLDVGARQPGEAAREPRIIGHELAERIFVNASDE